MLMERRMEKFERNGRGMKLVWVKRKWGSTFRCRLVSSLLRSDRPAPQTRLQPPLHMFASALLITHFSIPLLLLCVLLPPCFSCAFFLFNSFPLLHVSSLQCLFVLCFSFHFNEQRLPCVARGDSF